MATYYSVLGTGLMVHGIEKPSPNRIRYTVWCCVLYLPLFPVSTNEATPRLSNQIDASMDVSYSFDERTQLGIDWRAAGRTFVAGWSIFAAGLLPIAWVIVASDGRAATVVETVAAISGALFLGSVPMLIERRRNRIIEAKL